MFEIETVEIIGGKFAMGSSVDEIDEYISSFSYAYKDFTRKEVESWFAKQIPKNWMMIPSFHLATYPITNFQYSEFERYSFDSIMLSNIDKPLCPVEGVDFYDALAFCQFMSAVDSEYIYRLPTEAEWEFAASSRGRFRFPWGDEFLPNRANTAELRFGETSEVKRFEKGASEQGIFDLAGNVEEWTSSMYLPYPGGKYVADHISKESGITYPILRGGTYAHHGDLCLASRRHGFRQDYSIAGFRIVKHKNTTPHSTIT